MTSGVTRRGVGVIDPTVSGVVVGLKLFGVGEAPLGVGVGEAPLGVGVGEAPLGVGVGEAPLGVGVGEVPLGVGVGEVPLGVGVGRSTTGCWCICCWCWCGATTTALLFTLRQLGRNRNCVWAIPCSRCDGDIRFIVFTIPRMIFGINQSKSI